MNEGIHLTSFKDGVPFDFAGNGQKMLLSWTDSRYHNAWLALDRNHNGTIDNVQEMFGIPTQPQLAGTEPSGWAALRIYDTPAYGGNGDGFIDPGDKIYSDLLLWIDENHDGISQPNELHHLAEMGVHRIKLQYNPIASYTDQFGNELEFESFVQVVPFRLPGEQPRGKSPFATGVFEPQERPAWDVNLRGVFLDPPPTTGAPSLAPNAPTQNATPPPPNTLC
jgi:hypothetical protein